MPNNIPATALKISLNVDGSSTDYYVWPTDKRGVRYQWSAAGNNGEEDNQKKAMEAARNWIRFNVNPNVNKEN